MEGLSLMFKFILCLDVILIVAFCSCVYWFLSNLFFGEA